MAAVRMSSRQSRVRESRKLAERMEYLKVTGLGIEIASGPGDGAGAMREIVVLRLFSCSKSWRKAELERFHNTCSLFRRWFKVGFS
jgi:hypothetical protein